MKMTPEQKQETKEFWDKYKKQREEEYKEAKKTNPKAKRDNTLVSVENKERTYRKHEVKFSNIEKKSGTSAEGFVASKGHFSSSPADIYQRKINKKVMYRNIYRLPKEDREIFLDYLEGVKQVDIAEKFNISPEALNQRLGTIIKNYRVLYCNDKEFTMTDEYDKLQLETEEGFRKYIDEIASSGEFKVDLNEVQDMIKEIKKIISRTIKTKADINIKQKLSTQIDYSSLDDNWIKKTNQAFAEYGIEANFEKLKAFKGNIMQVLKMVDDFINQLKQKALR